MRRKTRVWTVRKNEVQEIGQYKQSSYQDPECEKKERRKEA